MQKSIFLFILAFFLISPYLYAEEPDLKTISPAEVKSLSNSEWQRVIDQIKSETQRLLKENEEFSADKIDLQEKLNDLNSSLDRLKSEVEKQKNENVRILNSRQQKFDKTGDLQKEVPDIQKDVAALESGNDSLREQLRSIEAKNQSLQQEIEKLETRKRELALDLKIHQFSKEESDPSAVEDKELQGLRQKLEQARKEDQKLSNSIEELSRQKESLPKELEKIQNENRALEKQIAELNKQQEQQKRSAQKAKMSATSDGALPAELIKEKKLWESKVEKLETQLEDIRHSVTASMDMMDRKQVLMDEVLEMDAENEKLRKKISSLMEESKDLDQQLETLDEPSIEEQEELPEAAAEE